MPHRVEAGLGPGHFVLDGDPAPPPPKGHTPNFRPVSIVAEQVDGSRWYLAWKYVSFVLNKDPAPPPKMWQSPPNFRLMYIVAKRLDGSE